jgi:hypothetical protein
VISAYTYVCIKYSSYLIHDEIKACNTLTDEHGKQPLGHSIQAGTPTG